MRGVLGGLLRSHMHVIGEIVMMLLELARNCTLGRCGPKKKDVQKNTRHYQYCSAENGRASLFLFHCNEYCGAIHHTVHICYVSSIMHYTTNPSFENDLFVNEYP